MLGSKLARRAAAAAVTIAIAHSIAYFHDRGEDTAPPLPAEPQVVVLQGEDGDIPFTVQRLNVYLVDNENYPESFEFEGDGLTLTGSIPVQRRVGYGENWRALVGTTIPFACGFDGNSGQAVATVQMPGGPAMRVVSGAFTVQEVGETYDARTPLAGQLWLRCRTAAGEQEFHGTFRVQGTTWG